MKYDSIFRPPVTQRIKSGRVLLAPGEEVGEHTTEKREEVIVVLKGHGKLVKGEELPIEEGQAYFIPEGVLHNVIKIGRAHV